MSKTANTLEEFLNAPREFYSIDLSFKNLSAWDCTRLAEAINANKTVTHFNLFSSKIGDSGAAVLANMCKFNTTLLHFNLGGNQIGDTGAVALAEAVKLNNTILYLYLHGNQIGDAGAAALAEGIRAKNKTLKDFHIQENQISSQGLELLKSSWQGNVNSLRLEGQKPLEFMIKSFKRAAELEVKLQQAEQKLTAITNDKQAKQVEKAARVEAEKLAQVLKLQEAEKLKAEKIAFNQKALEEEKVKGYDPQIDINIAKIFDNIEQVQADQQINYNDAIEKISSLMREGNNRLQEPTAKGILLLGNTGAGKSTLAHLLSGRKLQAIVDDVSGELIIDAMQPLNDIVIGHKMASETKIPNKCSTNGVTIWDCPGFNDTAVEQEIANSFYIKKLFETTDQMKFVLVVPEHHLVKDKGQHFITTLSSFMKTFSNIEATKDSISLVITQVSTHKKFHHIKNSIEKILTDNQSVTAEQMALVEKLLVNSSLYLFHQPKEEGEINHINFIEAIVNSNEFVISNPDLANMSVSEKALECSSHLLSTASNNFNNILEVTVKAILDATSCLTVNPNNIFSQNYNDIEPLIPASINYKNLADHEQQEYFLELNLLSKLQKILGNNQIGSIAEGLNVLEQIVETIAEYAQAGQGENAELKHQIQDFGYCLKQQHEYVKFFAGVCGKELPNVQNLAELLSLCQAKVSENLEFQVSSMHINHDIINPDYYHKALKYLEHYPDSKPCIKLKALCYNSLADIAEQQYNTDGAVNLYVEAIKADKHQPETYEKLGKLYFSKGQYAKAIEAYKVVNNEFRIKACFKAWLTQDSENPDIMLKQAEYFESIGRFDAARKYYGFAGGLSKDGAVKDMVLAKIGSIMTNAVALGQNFLERAQDHDYFNFDSVNEGFINGLLGVNPPADFHA